MSSRLGRRKRMLLNEDPEKRDPPDFFSKEWFKQNTKKDNNAFQHMITYAIAMLFTIVWAIFDDYPGTHQAILFGCLVIFLLSLMRRNDVNEMLKNTGKVFRDFRETTLPQVTDSLFVFNVCLALVSLLFIVDTGILSDSVFRIGAAAAFGLCTLLKHVIQSFRYT